MSSRRRPTAVASHAANQGRRRAPKRHRPWPEAETRDEQPIPASQSAFRNPQSAIKAALEGIPIPIDLVVVTPEEVQKYRDAIGTIIQEAVQEGKVLYDRAT